MEKKKTDEAQNRWGRNSGEDVGKVPLHFTDGVLEERASITSSCGTLLVVQVPAGSGTAVGSLTEYVHEGVMTFSQVKSQEQQLDAWDHGT